PSGCNSPPCGGVRVMSAIVTMSPSQRAGGPGWCSTRDMDKSREIAIENRVISTLVIFLMHSPQATQDDGRGEDRAACCYKRRQRRLRHPHHHRRTVHSLEEMEAR